jgi:hypothetical protein
MVSRVSPRALAARSLPALLVLAGLTLAFPCSAKDDEEASKEDASAEASSGDDTDSNADSSKTKSDGDATDAEKPASDGDKSADEDRGHMGQFGLRAGLVAGFRMVLRYSDSPFCHEPDLAKPLDKQQKFCGHVAPLAADFGLSFGVLDFLEPFLWARLGLGAEEQTDTKPLVVLGAGVRLYTMSDAAIKIFIEPAVGWELEGGRGTLLWQLNDPEYDKDFFFHLAAGPQFDFSRNVGAYLTAGVSAGVLRALGSSLDLNLGIQGRYP